MLRHLLLGLSTVFIFWLTLAVAVAAYRIVRLASDYYHLRWWGAPKRQFMMFLPGFVLLGAWSDYQRFRIITFVLENGEMEVPLGMVIGLAVGTTGCAIILWPIFSAALGERDGNRVWWRIIALGLLMGLFSAVIYGA